MTEARADAYRTLMRQLRVLGPAKLRDRELSRVRDVADTLLFAEGTAGDNGVAAARACLAELAAELLNGRRWLAPHVRRFVDDVLACGPGEQQLLRSLPGTGRQSAARAARVA